MNRKCFTLIEVLLSLFITAILITILSVIFNMGLRSYRQGRDLMEITRKAQMFLGQITRELSGAMVQDNRISFEITDSGQNDSIYFMSPIENPSKLDLCEIGYFLADTNGDGILDLRRHYSDYDCGSLLFEYPNIVVYTTGNVDTFCTNVTQLDFRYRLVNDTNWTAGTWSSTTQIPEMIEIRVRIEGEYTWKEFTTWVYIPNSTVNP